MNNVLEYLEASAAAFPNKTAVKDDKTSCTYSELLTDAKKPAYCWQSRQISKNQLPYLWIKVLSP